MSAHSASQQRGILAALASQLSAYVLEPLEPVVETEPAELEPYPVLAVVSSRPRCGATTVARMLAAELALRGDGAALVWSTGTRGRRRAAVSRAALRLGGALTGVAETQPLGRLCLAGGGDVGRLVAAARYLAPVVLDLAPDGSAAAGARRADRVVVVAAATDEPALARAVALVIGGQSLTAVNRVGDRAAWEARADVFIPDSRIAARAALLGTRALGALGGAIAELADAVEVPA